MRDHDTMSVLYVPHQKKAFAKHRWRTDSRWQIALIPVVSFSSMTYVNVSYVFARVLVQSFAESPTPRDSSTTGWVLLYGVVAKGALELRDHPKRFSTLWLFWELGHFGSIKIAVFLTALPLIWSLQYRKLMRREGFGSWLVQEGFPTWWRSSQRLGWIRLLLFSVCNGCWCNMRVESWECCMVSRDFISS
jgi:hypothetical protein